MQLYATLLIIAILIIYQIYALIAYVDKTNRDLSRFLHAIKHTDFSQSFTGTGLGSSFRELNAAFSDVIEQFRKARSEKEEHYRYLQTLVQHVGIGLISFKPDGEVDLINTAAKRLLRVSHLKNILSLQSSYPRLVETLPHMKSGERDAHGGPKIGEQIGPEIVSDIREASDTIQKRSDGLLHFVEAYRRLTKIPQPEFRIIPVAELFNQVQQLMRSKISENAVSFRTRVSRKASSLPPTRA
jgi:nitrogen fixation/metabolism regulation signal transduction histidine kinase